MHSAVGVILGQTIITIPSCIIKAQGSKLVTGIAALKRCNDSITVIVNSYAIGKASIIVLSQTIGIFGLADVLAVSAHERLIRSIIGEISSLVGLDFVVSDGYLKVVVCGIKGFETSVKGQIATFIDDEVFAGSDLIGAGYLLVCGHDTWLGSGGEGVGTLNGLLQGAVGSINANGVSVSGGAGDGETGSGLANRCCCRCNGVFIDDLCLGVSSDSNVDGLACGGALLSGIERYGQLGDGGSYLLDQRRPELETIIVTYNAFDIVSLAGLERTCAKLVVPSSDLGDVLQAHILADIAIGNLGDQLGLDLDSLGRLNSRI